VLSINYVDLKSKPKV